MKTKKLLEKNAYCTNNLVLFFMHEKSKLFGFQKLPTATGTNVNFNVMLACIAFSRSKKCLDLRCHIIENIHPHNTTKIHIKGLGYTL